MDEDFYKILGVSKDANPDEIKRAYIKLAHKYHPDKSGGDEKRFKEINEAYQTLSNAEKRAQYDRFGKSYANMGGSGGQSGFGGGQGFGGFGGFNGGEWNANFGGDMGDLRDILEGIFGGGFDGGTGRQRRRTYERGADLEMRADIALEEAKSGKKIETKFETNIACATCKGVGFDAKSGFDECSQCNGRGEIREQKKTFFGNFAQVVVCKKCNGAGKIPKKQCGACFGAGRVKGSRSVLIEIRPGVEDEQIIKVKGMGEAGEHGMESGDLYVRIHVKPNPNFERKGDDVYTNIPINVVDALLGKKKEIRNLGGKTVSFEVPAGFNMKDDIRVKGEGMTSRGDLVIRPQIKTPRHLTAKAKKLLEDLEKEI